MRLSPALMVVMITISGLGSQAIAQCMDADRESEMAVGELSQHTFKDAAGRPELEFILTLPTPVCLRGKEDTDNVETARTIHLGQGNEFVMTELRRHLGNTVLVRGRPFGALTVHHHAPIVMTVRDVETVQIMQPQRGSALRTNLLDTIRPVFERETGGPVEFVVQRLNVIGEWAYGEVRAQRPGGKAIDWNRTRYAEDFQAGMFDPAASDFLLRRTATGWMVVESAMGPTDVVWEGWRLDHRLPLALFQW